MAGDLSEDSVIIAGFICYHIADRPGKRHRVPVHFQSIRQPIRRKGLNMLTLRKLQQMVDLAMLRSGKNVPTAKAVRESGSEIVAKIIMCDGSRIYVYQNGYVVYYSGRRVTVFPLHDIKGDYICPTVDYIERPDMCICEDELLSLPWYYGIMLKADERIEHSIDNSRANQIQIPMDFLQSIAEGIADPEPDGLEVILLKEKQQEEIAILKRALQYVTAAQYEVLMAYFFEDMEQEEIARKLGITQQAVSDRYQRALARMRAGLGISINDRTSRSETDNAQDDDPVEEQAE